MNSMPASSAICASRRQSGQLPDQRSGTRVTARPEEQFDPNKPSLSLFELYIDLRSRADALRASTIPPGVHLAELAPDDNPTASRFERWPARINRLPAQR